MLFVRAWVNEIENGVFEFDIHNEGLTEKGGDERYYSVTACVNDGVDSFRIRHNRSDGAGVLVQKVLQIDKIAKALQEKP